MNEEGVVLTNISTTYAIQHANVVIPFEKFETL